MSVLYSIEYSVKNSQGEIIDSNKGEAPLEFIEGQNQIIPALEREISKMQVGEEREIFVEAKDAYGLRDENLVETLPKEQFEGIELKKGMTLYGQTDNNQIIAATVKDFDNNSVTIDYNHPLAGEDLTFNVKLLSKSNQHSCGYGCGH